MSVLAKFARKDLLQEKASFTLLHICFHLELRFVVSTSQDPNVTVHTLFTELTDSSRLQSHTHCLKPEPDGADGSWGMLAFLI